MQDILDFFLHIIDPDWILSKGIYLLLLIVFAETGLFIGFFLPGDSLLFIAGIYVNKLQTTLWQTINLVSLASIVGNIIGYITGLKAEGLLSNLFKKKESFLFSPDRLEKSKIFFEKYGAIAIILARFLPIVRTFVPVIAGIAKMNFKNFMLYNIVGGYLWVVSLILGGYYLSKEFPWIQDNLLMIIIILIIVTLLPALISVIIKISKSSDKNSKKVTK
ncbi:MAG: DedA family protein [Solitalea-like symbiont of Acarus siro]